MTDTSVRARLAGAQKSPEGAPAYSRFVNRPLGRVLAAAAFRLGRTPTQVTLVSGATTTAGIVVLAAVPASAASGVLAAALLVLGYALDSADGQLARLTGTGSLAGEWLDHFLDAFKCSALHLAVLVGWFRFGDLDPAWLLVPVVYAVVSSTFFFGIVGVDLLRRIGRLQGLDGAARSSRSVSLRTSPLYALLVAPADYGVLCVVIALSGLGMVFVGLYTALAAANLLVLVVCGLRWFRSLRSFAPVAAAR